jgi:hypothetical protein
LLPFLINNSLLANGIVGYDSVGKPCSSDLPFQTSERRMKNAAEALHLPLGTVVVETLAIHT